MLSISKFIVASILTCALVGVSSLSAKPQAKADIKALLITGGCCHDYNGQRDIIPMAVDMNSKLKVEWTIVHQRTDAFDGTLELYKSPDWAKGYDVVVHNECFAAIRDVDYMKGIVAPHRAGVPAVMVHCAMHSYRIDEWRELCGVSSVRHGPHHAFEVQITNVEHEIMRGLTNWKTPKGELYFIDKVYPTMTQLAQSKSDKTGALHPNVWVNEFGPNKTRVFATTIGHHNETMLQQQYMELLTRGLLWAAGKSVAESIKQN